VKGFKGPRNFIDDARSGRQSTVTCVEIKGKTVQRIWDNRRISINKTASEMSVMERGNSGMA